MALYHQHQFCLALPPLLSPSYVSLCLCVIFFPLAILLLLCALRGGDQIKLTSSKEAVAPYLHLPIFTSFPEQQPFSPTVDLSFCACYHRCGQTTLFPCTEQKTPTAAACWKMPLQTFFKATNRTNGCLFVAAAWKDLTVGQSHLVTFCYPFAAAVTVLQRKLSLQSRRQLGIANETKWKAKCLCSPSSKKERG